MSAIHIHNRTLGVDLTTTNAAEVRVWAPLAGKIEIDINNRQKVSLLPEDHGYWSQNNLPLKKGDNYAFIINKKNRFPDPASLSQPNGVHQDSEVIDLSEFKWNDDTWKGIDTRDLVIYELHTGAFSEEGNFKGIINKLAYLKDLGITAIEIMPVAAFPGERNWGYDGVYPFAVHKDYGGASGLQELVNACHKEGLAVILDVVCNHLGPEGNYLMQFAPYFTSKYKTPWGDAINFDDAWSDGVRRFYIENILMWLRDFHIDGIRLDAVHAIMDFSPKHITRELKEHVDKLNRISGNNHFIIAECDLNDVRFIEPYEKGGCNLNAQWSDEFHHALHAYVTGEKIGYYKDFGDLSQLVKAFNHAYVYDGLYSRYRKKTFGTSTKGFAADKFVVCSQNHDQVGNRMLGERLSSLVDYEMLKLIAGAVFFSPYRPLIFMGEEYGEKSPFQYFISHHDKELVKLVREGRKEEFKDFMQGKEPPDPQDIKTFENSKLKWGFHENEAQKKLLDYYKELIRIKKEHPLLRRPAREYVTATLIDSKGVMMIKHEQENNSLLALLNFSNHSFHVHIKDYTKNEMSLLLNSSSIKWSGPIKDDEDLLSYDGNCMIPAKSIIVLTSS